MKNIIAGQRPADGTIRVLLNVYTGPSHAVNEHREIEMRVPERSTHEEVACAALAHCAYGDFELWSVKYLVQGHVYTRYIDTHGWPSEHVKIERIDWEAQRNVFVGRVTMVSRRAHK